MMNSNSKVLSFELEHSRKRLSYYAQLKDKAVATKAKTGPIDKWLEIYSERVQKLEKQIQKLNKAAERQVH